APVSSRVGSQGKIANGAGSRASTRRSWFSCARRATDKLSVSATIPKMPISERFRIVRGSEFRASGSAFFSPILIGYRPRRNRHAVETNWLTTAALPEYGTDSLSAADRAAPSIEQLKLGSEGDGREFS